MYISINPTPIKERIDELKSDLMKYRFCLNTETRINETEFWKMAIKLTVTNINDLKKIIGKK